jgi:hypothetical protein
MKLLLEHFDGAMITKAECRLVQLPGIHVLRRQVIGSAWGCAGCGVSCDMHVRSSRPHAT